MSPMLLGEEYPGWSYERRDTRAWRRRSGRGRAGLRSGDQARAAAPGQVGVGPAGDHHEAVAEADEEEDVHEQPEPPGDPAGHAELADRRDRRAAADGREQPLVLVLEGQRGLAAEGAEDAGRRV